MAPNHLSPARLCAPLAAIAAFSLSAPARANINVPSDGSDGAFNPTADVQVDLSQAVTGTWSDNNAANAGKGVYDPVKWAVVFKYSSVNIPAAVTVTFKNHPSGAPVVWLVQGSATIAGTVNVSGKDGGSLGILTEAGPGGFQGGSGYSSLHPMGSGHGPGGGGQVPFDGSGFVTGSYATRGRVSSGGDGLPGPIYGNAAVLPLIGGSGGTGNDSQLYDGGAGGGALLLCAGNNVNIAGRITALGGITEPAGSGAGGGIRIIADSVSGNGQLDAIGGGAMSAPGGDGRIRIEANSITHTGSRNPTASLLFGVTAPVIWPPANIPTITITEIAGRATPADPHAVLSTSDHYTTVDVSPVTPITVRMNAVNVPVDWNVRLRVVPYYGVDTYVAATNVSGDATASVWEATITVAQGVSAIQARASKP